MRPRSLLIEAVGPYPGRVELDVDAVADDGIFLIRGRTGSGKSFLLDAITFALYGEVTGARQNQPLRSDHAAPDAEPVVCFDFTIDGVDWRVRRSPAHRRAKKRGTGTTEQSPSAALYRRQGDDWVAVESGVRQVTAEVQRLLGLTREQFTQVVLLPQGDVERVLRAGSDDRERLLQALFGTAAFDTVAKLLDEEAQAREASVGSARDELAALRRRATELWAEVVPDAVPAVDTPDDEPVAAIDSLVRDAVARRDAIAQQTELAEQAMATAAAAHAEALALAERWTERDALRARLRDLDARSAEIDDRRERLIAAERAGVIAADLHVLAQARAAAADANEELESALCALDACTDRLGSRLPHAVVAARLDDAPVGEAVHALSALAISVRDELTLVEEQHHAHLRHEELVRRRATAAAAEHEAQLALGALTIELEQIDAAITEAKDAAERLPALADEADRADRRARAVARLVETTALLPGHRAAVERAERRLRDRQDAENAILRAYVDGMAGELAASLDDGEPCCVCGSVDHPAPAPVGADHTDRATLEAGRARTEAARAALTEATDALAAVNQAGAVLEVEVGGPIDAVDPEKVEAAALEAREALAAADRVSGALPQLHHDRAEVEQRRDAADRAAEEAHAALDEAERELRDVDDRLAELAARLEGTDPNELRRAGAALPELLELVEQLATRRAVRDEAAARLDLAQRAVVDLLPGAGFASEGEATAALFSPDDTAALRDEIEAFERERHATLRALEAPAFAHLAQAPPDTAHAERSLTEASNRARRLQRERTTLENATTTLERWRREAVEVEATAAPLATAADQARALADACRGHNAGRLSLQRWVLGTYLDHICGLANRRLVEMTGGRYTLHAHRDRERGLARSGLGLRVLDAHTGVSRDVATLSGGETFQASLALALGIADAVTAASGGIRLDALFVDEGFGSLDPEALDQAMTELGRLRDGNRLVGVISHVAAMQEQIPLGVEVVAGERGSTLRHEPAAGGA